MSNIKAAKEKPMSSTVAKKKKPIFNPSIVDGKSGIDVLRDPSINKSTGFTEPERQALGLVGLVPEVTESIETQLSRVTLQLKHKATDLDRFTYLMSLLDTNETLFYHALKSDPARFLEIVYDPTIGEACLKFDHIFRRPHGMYLSITRKGHVREVCTWAKTRSCPHRPTTCISSPPLAWPFTLRTRSG
jgi:Malic enzyme, N-terminal domain